MKRKSIAVVDDHPFIRLGVRTALAARPELQVVAESGDGLDAWLTIQRVQPDAVVLDIDLPKLNGYELMKRIQRMEKHVKILVLSMYTGQLPVQRAADAGANGFIYKSNGTHQVCEGCIAVLGGFRYFPGDGGQGLVQARTAGREPLGRLTDREIAIARHLVAGHANKEIGHRLFISDKTVSAHKHNIFRKLQIGNLIQLADYLRYADSYGVPRNELN